MKFQRVCLTVCAVAALAACTRAPGEQAMRDDVQGLLEAGFVPGLFEVVSARRANDFPFVLSGEHVDVRYDAVLRLKRDHRFGSWDQANIGTLTLVLGAAPSGVAGIKPSGNAAGDLIAVQGRVSYLAADGGLKIAPAPEAPPAVGVPGFVLVSDLQAQVKQQWRAFKERARLSRVGLMVEEAARARRAYVGRTARGLGGFSIATEARTPDEQRIGDAAEQAADEADLRFADVEVDGAQEALDTLRAGRVTAAVLRNTEAGLAAAGAAPFTASGPYRLSALAALYPAPVHIVVKADSPLGSPAELFGKHVGVAGTARVDAVEAEAVLRGHGVPLAALAAPLMSVTPAEALDQLAAGAFDALVMTTPLPSRALREFAARAPVRLLPFDSDAIAFLTSGAANYVAITVPARTYPGQDRPLAAVAAVTMLVSVESVDAKEAAALLDFMLTRVDYFRFGSVTGAMIARDTAQKPMTLPWHPGAASFFEGPPKE